MMQEDDRETLINNVVDMMSIDSGDFISVHNLQYAIAKRKTRRVILHDISGIFQPGMNAILGPTGSGKTTLLDILAGRRNMSSVSGHVLVNGSPQPKYYSQSVGYVVQSDEVVMGTLTVRENITFSANLRLSSSVSRAQKDKRVQDIIDELGLGMCAESVIGTPMIRGVSGGERRRTNIGMELIISQSVLFLDEPTTGLDASTANSVMSLLHSLSLRGCTIIFSIHQPRYMIYKQFDWLMLLADGRSTYHGPANEALQFFSSIGYVCDLHTNPSDFFLDVVSNEESAMCQKAPAGANGIKYYSGTAMNGMTSTMNALYSAQTVAQQISKKFTASRWQKE